MIKLRRGHERGHANHGWLDTYHTFSFSTYHDPRHMRFRSLRVINEDRVQPGAGFPTHPHEDMEILTYVLEGALAHRDSMGNGSVIVPGEVQRMSAGTGVTHSEHNASKSEPVHFLQIWLLPERRGLRPSYEQRALALADRPGALQLIAARDGRDGAVTIHQDVDLWAAVLGPDEKVNHRLRPGRHGWLQVARGAGALNGVALEAGDGAAISQEDLLQVHATAGAEFLLFDLA